MTEPTENQDSVLSTLVDIFQNVEKWSGLDEDGFCNHYLQELGHCDSDEAKVKEMAAVMLADVDRRRRALAYVHGERFSASVLEKLDAQKGKSKTVKFLHGTAGSKAVQDGVKFIKDQHAETVKWADENLESADWIGSVKKTDAVKVVLAELNDEEFAEAVGSMLVTPFKDHFKDTGEIPPGIEVTPAHEGFHINGKIVDLGQLAETVKAELDVPNALLPQEARKESTDE